MIREFSLPDLGEGLEEATVTVWFVDEGDTVELNQPIAEIETAKASVEMPSPYAGVIRRLHAVAGSTVRVGDPLVTYDVAGPRVGAATGAAGSGPPSVAATPAVRKAAKDLGVDLSAVPGTGPEGRVTREDVERAAGGAVEPEAIPVSGVRRAIAGRLTEAAAIPQVTTFRTVDCLRLDGFRRELGVSPLPVVVRALAEIRATHPMLNAEWAGDRILVHRALDVGVATDTDRGLLVPVVRDAGSRGIGDIAREIERLAEAARAAKLGPEDLSGATITVSNTGSYGSEYGTPLLNPPNAVTLALGVIRPRPLVVDGAVVAGPACTLSVTFDHRVLDGATVGRALTDLVAVLESRERLEALPR